MTAKNPQKQGRILKGGGKNFSGWPEYIPLNYNWNYSGLGCRRDQLVATEFTTRAITSTTDQEATVNRI